MCWPFDFAPAALRSGRTANYCNVGSAHAQETRLLVPVAEHDPLGFHSVRIEVMRGRPVRVAVDKPAYAVRAHRGFDRGLVDAHDLGFGRRGVFAAFAPRLSGEG